MIATQLAHVLFDEAHSEAWTIDPELAREMQPAHPSDASYARAADALRERDFVVTGNREGQLDSETLADVDVLVLAHPADPLWERTTGSGLPRLSASELDAIEAFVRSGGGLIVLGETEHEKYGNNINELLARFELRLENHTVQDYEHFRSAPSWILADLQLGVRGREGDVLARVREACLYRATTIGSENGARVLARTHHSASLPGAPLIVSATRGTGRVVVLADSDLFGDDCIGEFDHRDLWLNVVYWAAGARGAIDVGALAVGGSGALGDPAWAQLRDQTNALQALQSADGSLEDAGAGEVARGIVDQIVSAIGQLAGRFPHDSDYLELVVRDLQAWVNSGTGRPDFTGSLKAFRPELRRRDGIEHLVFFPMYKQNGPRESVFEALLVRVRWPDFVAELERTRYDNPQFVPVELLDGTRGYDSECATLFPETVSVSAGSPEHNFGAIFCDREAARTRRVCAAAADLLQLNLPPDAARLLSDPELSKQAYILWDLIHDRAHSHGELPFDPFMIRQRSPYWMYALEELRCDLTAFVQALELEEPDDSGAARSGAAERRPGSWPEGLAFARYVQYAILLDRGFRFPITGLRVRNYDGLGGQLLFAYLHRHGHAVWADNQLTVNWRTVGEGVRSLFEEVSELYREGIGRSKLAQWMAAHDFVSQYVPPAAGSQWAAGTRSFRNLEDPRPYVDLVLEDEFPLSLFFASLKNKLGT